MINYHNESQKIYENLLSIKDTLTGGTVFSLGDVSIDVEGKDGIGGLIEEWFGIWAIKNGFIIEKTLASQEFPDFYVGSDKALLEIKTFDRNAGANFDIANFESYCSSLANNPNRLYSDYLIFGYKVIESKLVIADIWLKKVWEITCPSERWALKTQTKRDVIYNIRPASWFSDRARFEPFNSANEFVDALYKTQEQYLGRSDKALYLQNSCN